MKKLFIKAVVFIFLLLFGYILSFIVHLVAIEKEEANNSDCIYIWGDSECYQGFDIDKLADSTHKKVYTSATHGSGVYDFLVFADRVPKSSFCIISISPTCLVRIKENDYNRSGFSLFAVSTLLRNGYSLKEIVKISRINNFRSKLIFNKFEKSNLYAYSDTICDTHLLEMYAGVFKKVPTYEDSKYQSFKSGFELLKEKNCRILLVEFPWHKSIINEYRGSVMKQTIDTRFLELSRLFCNSTIDSLCFKSGDSLCMHDLTHMNIVGATRATKCIGEYFKRRESSSMVILNNLVCE